MGKYILTGGPGTGKTTILQELRRKGYSVVSEVARQIIFEEQEKEKGILPWTDLALFQDLVIERQLRSEEEATNYQNKKIFLDRSLVDGIAFAEIGKITIKKDLSNLIEQADYKRVFYLEQLPFYSQDKERKEDPELAKRIHEQLYRVYDRLGFDIVTVPAVSVEERIKLILNETNAEKNREIERKYQVGHDLVKSQLTDYMVKSLGTAQEENKLYDFKEILKNLDCVVRIRKNNEEHLLTLKGPNRSADFTNKLEYNIPIPEAVSKILQAILPESISYSKLREMYQPLGDASCTVCLDTLPGLGEFVEIEAASENQVLLWEKRLRITDYAIRKSYPALVKEHEIANSR